MAKAVKKVEIGDWRQQVGQALDRAIARANRTQKEVWAALGHNDGAQLNRWIAGTERPQFDALFAIAWLRAPLVIELAKMAGAGIEIETTVRIREVA